jgi:hypothetical protein
VVTLTTPTTEFSSPELEASGHAYVRLSGQGQSVQWTNNTCFSITAVNIRACIPDSAGGGGINATLDLYVNGVLRQAVNLNSTQTWVYETSSAYNGMSQAPSAGNPHVFWDEFPTFITGAAVAPGSTIMLKVDAANTASFYYVDCVDVEAPPPPLAQPANALSIDSYGAVANSPSTDNSTAIRNCIAAAQSAGKAVWIPSGTYYANITTAIYDHNGTTIEGAGPWYSTILDIATSGTVMFYSTGATFQNLRLDATSPVETTTNQEIYAINATGDNWTLNNVWARHAMLCWGKGNNILVENCRVNNSWGDGLNINNTAGTSSSNITVTNNFARGNGDDGITLNSSDNTAPDMTGCTYTHNTSVASWWASEMGIYGGVGDIVEYNLLKDSVKNNGLRFGIFGTGGSGSDGIGALAMGNEVVRGGSYGYGNHNPAIYMGGVGSYGYVLSTNTITNAMFDGIDYETGVSLTAQYNTIKSPGLNGIGVAGTGSDDTFINNTVTGLNAGQTAFLNNDGTNVVTLGTPAASYSASSGVVAEACGEGGQDLGTIVNGSYAAYSGINMAGLTAFHARVASAGAGGSIQIHLDSPTGTLIGTCNAPVTGGWQTWATQSCSIAASTGTHTIYLVASGGSGNLFNIEWFSFP